MRAGQPFAMRYPLVEVEGSYGNLMESGNWAASRYTSSRLSALAEYLFKDIDKETIDEWRDNYDDTEQYPSVLTSKGYFNVVNGTLGIGVGAAASIPQYNLREVNEALIKLLWNSEISFDEIYCAPDFATGAILLNEKEVKDSMRDGYGNACKLRSVIEYDEKEKCLIITEIPYSVYTNTICGELEGILESEENVFFERFNDLTGKEPLIKIYLKKNANVSKAIKYLYKNTSLQSYYGINFTMLDKGRFPKQFGWKELLQSYLDHQFVVYRRGFEFDLKKIKNRLHIVKGMLKAYDMIDEVIHTIKTSSSAAIANEKLRELLEIDEIQAKAILNLKLSSLSKLDISKLRNEKESLENEQKKIENILNDDVLFKKEIENGLREVAEKFGDNRRTKILNIESEEDEPVEQKSLVINLTNKNNIFVSETSSLYTQRRGGVGSKFKLEQGEYIIDSSSIENVDTVLFFTKETGICYTLNGNDIPIGTKTSLNSLIEIKPFENICAFTSYNKKNSKPNTIIFTKNGMMKKSLLSEYNSKRKNGIKAIELNSGDEVCSVLFVNDDEKVGVLTEQGQFLIFGTKDIRPLGRIAKGIKAIKLDCGDAVVTAKVINDTCQEIVSISKEGYIKRTPKNEFPIGSRYTKGAKIQKLVNESSFMVDFIPIAAESEIIVTSSTAQIKIKVNEVPLLSKSTQGTKAIKMNDKNFIVALSY